ncbi:MAG: twin-arginine translocation signal domain-containing protein [Pirellulaceae bacterium]
MTGSNQNRRTFMKASAAGATMLALPSLVTAKRAASRPDEVIVGQGDYQYTVNHAWCQLPDKYQWQTTHNVAVDSENNLYVIHEGNRQLKDHPAIFVFDGEGKFVRAFGCQFQGGGHGIEIRKEGDGEYLYVAAYQQVKAFAKMTLQGDTVWFKKAPMESGIYADGEDVSTEPTWSRSGFLPTNFAFLDDGGFLLADGYGTFHIHRFDSHGNWVNSFGGAGDGKGTFNTAHGLWVDKRDGVEARIVVTDRAHDTLQVFDMEGNYQKTLDGFGLPANIDTQGALMLVPELKARISLLDTNDQVVATLGAAVERLDEVQNLRGQPDKWLDGQFVHPHDACFDRDGNIFVAEWVSTGRITKLTKKS